MATVSIDVPSSAKEGESVPVTVQVTNNLDYNASFKVKIYAVRDIYAVPEPHELIDSFEEVISSGLAKTYGSSFTMPAWDTIVLVMVHRFVDYWDYDTHASKVVSLEVSVEPTYHLDVFVPSWAWGGSVEPNSGDYPAHSTVTLTAHPFSDYQFLSWGGDASGTAPTFRLLMDGNKYVEAYFKKVPVAEFTSSIARMELEYDETRENIPVAASVPIATRGLIHVWGRNDMDTSQKLGIRWIVKDPDGIVVKDYQDWEFGRTGPGDDHEFIGGRFDIDKPGDWLIGISLSMNRSDPIVVDSYAGILCRVTGVVEAYAGKVIKKELEFDETRGSIPVAANVPIGQQGLVHIWGRNDTSVPRHMGIHWVVKDPEGVVVENYEDWVSAFGINIELDPGDNHEFIGGRFDLNKEGTYSLAVDLLMNRSDPLIVDSYEGDLCTTTLEVPPEFELIQHTVYPYAYVYDGKTDFSLFTFTTAAFIPTNWIAGKFAKAVESEVEKAGGRVIDLKVYADKSPLLWTHFRIEVQGIPLGAAQGVGVPVGMPLWAIILIVALSIAFLIAVITWSIDTITKSFTHKPINEEIKKAMTPETLIRLIGDLEVKLERPLTPVGELEQMSDEKLRVYCDSLAEVIVPPAVAWVPLAIVAGIVVVGVVGGGTAIALATRGK